MCAQTPTLSLIAAVAENDVIGNNNRLPWHLPEDLQHFKRLTEFKPIIMGRKTFESLKKPLPNRLNIVVSRNKTQISKAESVVQVSSLESAIKVATHFYEAGCPYDHAQAELDFRPEIMVIGGAQLYALALDQAKRIYITQVTLSPPGDCYFSEWRNQNFKTVQEDGPYQSSKNIGYKFLTLERVTELS